MQAATSKSVKGSGPTSVVQHQWVKGSRVMKMVKGRGQKSTCPGVRAELVLG